jgi:hypothetical protein
MGRGWGWGRVMVGRCAIYPIYRLLSPFSSTVLPPTSDPFALPANPYLKGRTHTNQNALLKRPSSPETKHDTHVKKASRTTASITQTTTTPSFSTQLSRTAQHDKTAQNNTNPKNKTKPRTISRRIQDKRGGWSCERGERNRRRKTVGVSVRNSVGDSVGVSPRDSVGDSNPNRISDSTLHTDKTTTTPSFSTQL